MRADEEVFCFRFCLLRRKVYFHVSKVEHGVSIKHSVDECSKSALCKLAIRYSQWQEDRSRGDRPTKIETLNKNTNY